MRTFPSSGGLRRTVICWSCPFWDKELWIDSRICLPMSAETSLGEVCPGRWAVFAPSAELGDCSVTGVCELLCESICSRSELELSLEVELPRFFVWPVDTWTAVIFNSWIVGLSESLFPARGDSLPLPPDDSESISGAAALLSDGLLAGVR